MSTPITLNDFKIRYINIRKQNPHVKKCTVSGCSNPRDSTPMSGEDTCCAYHRMLFDWWVAEIAKNPLAYSQKGRRRAFSNWLKRIGKGTQDEIVLKMAQEGINWEC